MDYKRMPSILDASPEALKRYLDQTGKTLEELKADLAWFDKVVEDNEKIPTIERADPTQEHKFTMPIGIADD